MTMVAASWLHSHEAGVCFVAVGRGWSFFVSATIFLSVSFVVCRSS